MRRRNLFIVAALCVTLALGGCRSNKLEDTGNAGTQGESTADGLQRKILDWKSCRYRGKNCRTRQ